jgi:hypothetical protein
MKPTAGMVAPWELYALDLRSSDGVVRFIVSNGEEDGWYGCWDAAYTIPIEQWLHVAATYDGNKMKLYIDGTALPVVMYRYTAGTFEPVDSASIKIGSNGEPLLIGASNGDGIGNFDGLIDDMRLFDRPLTPEEICALYTEGATGAEKSLGKPRQVRLKW